MDDLAPAPAQRATDDGRRTPEGNLAARRMAVKKVQPAPAQAPEPEPDHQLDVLA